MRVNQERPDTKVETRDITQDHMKIGLDPTRVLRISKTILFKTLSTLSKDNLFWFVFRFTVDSKKNVVYFSYCIFTLYFKCKSILD